MYGPNADVCTGAGAKCTGTKLVSQSTLARQAAAIPQKSIWHDSHFFRIIEETVKPTPVSRWAPPRYLFSRYHL